jgi:integrase/recombinase XerD
MCSTSTTKQELIKALLSNSKLRVSQITSLRYAQFDMQERQVAVETKARREKIKLQETTYELLRQHVLEQEPEDLQAFVFPSPTNPQKPISTRSINYLLEREAQRQGLPHVTPRQLRAKAPEVAAEVAKPEKLTLRKLVADFKAKELPAIALNLEQAQLVPTGLFIGRVHEIEQANRLLSLGVNVVVTGEAGVGKNCFLDQLQYPLPALVLDDTKDFKKSLANAVVFLLGGDEEEARAKLELTDKVNKESMVNLACLLCELVPKKSHILRITDVSDITPMIVRVLKEKLVEHFVIVATARELRKDRSDFLWSFERVELQNLWRAETIQLTYQLCEQLPVEDFTYLKNQVWNASHGNPRMITQICERLSREFGLIQRDTIARICNAYLGKRAREIDMSFLFLGICLIVFLVAWYRTGAERQLLRYAQYFVFVTLIFGRAFFGRFKRNII